ncbi:hypothetical protein B0H19DRAFT_999131 [Mycena capillaripes]|nr:hypothetical protein B0H19DRAFT_999131 [Mycena capillaripes]
MSQICLICGALTVLESLPDLPAVSSPDLTHLLKSNNPPRESEVPSIRAIISDGQDHLAPLNAQISTLEAQIRDLNAILAEFVRRRDEAVEHIRQHRAILSPIRHMPTEVIQEIFTSLPSDPSDGEAAGNKGPPWYLGHISRSWRNAALSFTPLWSAIVIGTPASVEVQLLRSAHVPLDIYWSNVQSQIDPSMLDSVLLHCNRWRSLSLDHRSESNRQCTLDWLHPVNGHLDQLAKLEVAHSRIAVPDILSTAPNLREVLLTDEYFRSRSPSIIIPWHQITHYRGAYSPGRQLEILNDAPNLLECAIGFKGFGDSNSPINPTLPHLRRLFVEGMHLILGNVTAPLLEDLCAFSSPAHELFDVLPFIHRSSSTLKKLSLMRCTIGPDLIAILHLLPGLTHLVIEHSRGVDDAPIALFTAMSLTNTSAVCPNLTSIVYGYQFQRESSRNAFFAMARSRFQPTLGHPRRLSLLRVFMAEDSILPSHNMVAQMKALQDEGFDADFLDIHETSLLKKTAFETGGSSS